MNSKTIQILLIVVSIIALSYFIFSNQKLIKESNNIKNNLEQNNIALKDSLHQYKTANNTLLAETTSYKSSLDNLQNINKSLYDKINKYEYDIRSYNNLIFSLKQDKDELDRYITNLKDTIHILSDSTYQINWKLRYDYDADNYDYYEGNTNIKYINHTLSHLLTEMTLRESKVSLVWGNHIDENGMLRVFAETSHPAFRAELLEGVVIDNPYESNNSNDKKWFTGFGVGPSLGIMYYDSKPNLYLGVGIHYNVYQF